MPDSTWASASGPVKISAKRLVATKTVNGQPPERHVVLYFYVKGRLFEDSVTMVEVSALAPVDGPYDDVLVSLKNFMGETVPYVFEHGSENEGEMLAVHLAQSWGGRTIMGFLALIPPAILIYPRVRRS